MKSVTNIIPVIIASLFLGACSTTSNGLMNPELSPIGQPYPEQVVSMPMPEPKASTRNRNSLWQNGSTAFFRDQRASEPGDILTVLVDVRDEARLKNESSRNRRASENIAAPHILGLENKIPLIDAKSGVGLTSSSSHAGSGEIDRDERIRLKVAAVVTQRLPNGNLVIQGKQELRVNNEMRELVVAGVIRPQDISGSNTVSYDQIAEARVSYGGKGVISNVQRPRYGQRAVDIVLPW